jgi:hypothetical protein
LTTETIRTQLPLTNPYVHEEPRKITKEEREFKAYRALRDGRAQARHEGKRKLRAQKVGAIPHPLPSLIADPLLRIQKKEEEAAKTK